MNTTEHSASGHRRGAFLQTFTTRKVYPLDLRLEDIDIRDIAHSLSLLCRYNGHAKHMYSVAEHSVLLAVAAPEGYRREALLHDAAEYLLGDVPRPLKVLPEFAFFREAEAKVEALIFAKFGVASTDISRAAVAALDHRILANEARALLGPPVDNWTAGIEPLEVCIDGWPPRYAEEIFLDMFCDLFPEHEKGIRP